MHSALHFVFSVGWIVLSAFSYGYHISALNGAQDVITCRSNRSRPSDQTIYPSLSLLTPCIPMSDNLFGLLTASYTIGGSMGSVYAAKLAARRGKRTTLLISAVSIGVGSLVMSLANFFLLILLGRTVVGIGCGINTVLVPIYLSEISPARIRGSVGVMNQLAIVFGIFSSQLLSLPLARPFVWRWIFVVSAASSALQVLSAPLLSEETHPKPATSNSLPDFNPDPPSSSSPTSSHHHDDFERETLLTPGSLQQQPRLSNPHQHQASLQTTPLSVSQLLFQQSWKQDPALASGLTILIITQLAQQLSGINAVLYYSTSIMKSVLPTKAIYISLFITAINVIMTFPAIFLVDKLGRKCLLLLSAGLMASTSLILGLSINYEVAHLSSLAIVLFVASFSVGLGPIPFVILSEVVPAYAVGAAGSLGLALNWAANFFVGLVFLPLRNLLASPDGDGDGNVFFIFTLLGALSTLLIHTKFRV